MPNYDARSFTGTDLGKVSGTVTSLPAGYVLGEERWENAAKYRLMFNAGGASITQGFAAAPIMSAGPYSLTVTTTSKTFDHIGAGFALNATVPTAAFFWGAVRFRGAVVGDASSVPTGSFFYIASDGKVELTVQSVMTGNQIIGVNLGGAASKTITTGVLSGDAYVTLE